MKREELLIAKLNLTAHPEGGYFKETYRSVGTIDKNNLSESYGGERNFCTSIYFLLKSDDFSAFHKINQDETWHFYEGSTITIHQISPDGIYTEVVLGNTILNNQFPQYTVPGGYWFGATINEKNSYSLVGCTVAPGFDFDDFQLAKRNEIQKKFPNHKNIIEELTR
jgi:predicted cupin superfamily sugar epimerase